MIRLLRDAKHLLAPLTANCREFHQAWDRAAATPPGEMGGRWDGEWRSEATGHHGPLRGVVQPLAADRWRVYFRAGYSAVFRACYHSEFVVTPEDGRWTFRGESDLGRLAGGVYQHDGQATRREFVSTYRSRYDHGRFVLTRVTPGTPP
jgi:hypothetical protein